MLTAEQKAELEALKAKTDQTDDDKARMAELEAIGNEKTFSEAYVKGLRTEAAKYRTKNKEVEEKLAKLDGIDVDKYNEMIQKAEENETQKLKDSGQWETLKEQLVNTHAEEAGKWGTEKAELIQKAEGLEAELNSTILGQEIAIEAGNAKAINAKLVNITLASLGLVKVEKSEEGERSIIVYDDKGVARINSSGDPMSVKELLEDMKGSQEYAHLFAGGKVGAGSDTVHFHGQTFENPWAKDTINLTRQGEIFQKDKALANKLKAEAGVK